MQAIGAAAFTLVKAKTPTVDWTALWHVVVVSVAAGCGLALLFGLILLGWQLIEEGKGEGAKMSGWVLGVLAAAGCVAIIAAGLYVMKNPHKSSPNKVVPATSTT